MTDEYATTEPKTEADLARFVEAWARDNGNAEEATLTVKLERGERYTMTSVVIETGAFQPTTAPAPTDEVLVPEVVHR